MIQLSKLLNILFHHVDSFVIIIVNFSMQLCRLLLQEAVWIETYRNNIKPVNGETFWQKTGKNPIGVPCYRKMPGRPKKQD